MTEKEAQAMYPNQYLMESKPGGPFARPPERQPPQWGIPEDNLYPPYRIGIPEEGMYPPGYQPMPQPGWDWRPNPDIDSSYPPTMPPVTPVTPREEGLPAWLTAPPDGSAVTQAVVEHTNPITGEKFTTMTGGYSLNEDYMTTQFNNAYTDNLGRDIGAPGMDFYRGELDKYNVDPATGKSWDQIQADLDYSAEGQAFTSPAETETARVATQTERLNQAYMDNFGRGIAGPGLDFYSDQLNQYNADPTTGKSWDQIQADLDYSKEGQAFITPAEQAAIDAQKGASTTGGGGGGGGVDRAVSSVSNVTDRWGNPVTTTNGSPVVTGGTGEVKEYTGYTDSGEYGTNFSGMGNDIASWFTAPISTVNDHVNGGAAAQPVTPPTVVPTNAGGIFDYGQGGEVMGRQMFAHGGMVQPMQDGGMAAMPPQAPMMGAPMPPQEMGMEQAAQGAAAQGVDPGQLQQMLGDYDQQMTSIGAAEDYEGVINSIRGDQLPMEARYEELAGMVGPEDATATPESVLTLIQPVMQMAAVDQGIGGLAQGEMSTPIEGPMAEGIMSTVNMGATEGPTPVNFNQGGPVRYMAEAGVVLPNDQSAASSIDGRQGDLFRQQQAFYKNALLDPAQQSADFDEQKKMTKAQMWFDVAQGALAFASPGDRPMSPAERLAQSFSPVLGSIGARAGELNKFKQAQSKEEKQYDLAALTSAQGIYSAENAATAAAKLRADEVTTDQEAASSLANSKMLSSGNPLDISIELADGTIHNVTQPLSVGQLATLNSSGYANVSVSEPSKDALLSKTYNVSYMKDGEKVVASNQLLSPDEVAALKTQFGQVQFVEVAAPSSQAVKFTTISFPDGSKQDFSENSPGHLNAIKAIADGGRGGISAAGTEKSPTNLKLSDGSVVTATPGTARFALLTKPVSEKGFGGRLTGDVPQDSMARSQVTLTMDIDINGHKFSAGASPNLTQTQLSSIPADSYTAYVAPLSDKDYMTAYKMTKKQFEAQTPEIKAFLQGTGLSDMDYFDKFGMSQAQFTSLPVLSKNRLWGIETEYGFKTVNTGGKIDIMRYDKNDSTSPPVSIYSTAILQDPELFRVNMPDEKGVMTPTIIDLKTPSGQLALKKVNDLNKANPGSATMQKISSESNVAKTFLLPNSTAGGGSSVRMSFDGGKTYIGSDGLPRQLPANAFELSNVIANDVYRKEIVRSSAKDWLRENDAGYVSGLENPDGSAVSPGDKTLVVDMLQEVRNGTGPWSALNAGINALIGGALAPETFSELFKDTEQGRQYVKMIRIMGRSALAASPRFAVADLAATEGLFPSEEAWLRNSASEANKLTLLVAALNAEEARLYSVRASDTPQEAAVLATVSVKLQEIARLKELLGPTLTQATKMASPQSVTGALNLMRNKLPGVN